MAQPPVVEQLSALLVYLLVIGAEMSTGTSTMSVMVGETSILPVARDAPWQAFNDSAFATCAQALRSLSMMTNMTNRRWRQAVQLRPKLFVALRWRPFDN